MGLAVSLAGALAWRASERAHERQNFETTSVDVSEKLETLVQRDADFVTTLRALLTMQPRISQGAFSAWYSALEGRERQLGTIGTTVISSVPASRLASFLARRNADPAFRAAVKGKIIPVANDRARYCLISTTEAPSALNEPYASEAQGDWCLQSSPLGRSMGPIQRAATDSGQILVFPVSQPRTTTLLETAVYRRGAVLRTLAQRRAAVSGWIVTSFDVSSLITRAIGENRQLSLALYRVNPGGSAELVARAGTASGHGFTHTPASRSPVGGRRA